MSSVDPSRAAEFRSAGIKVGAALVVFAALFALYSYEVKVEGQVQELLLGPHIAGGQRAGGAKADLNKDTPLALLSAEASLQKALDLQQSNPYAVASYADAEAMLVEMGYPDRAKNADEWVARADAKNITLPERYEASALRLIQQARAAEAETMLMAVIAKYGTVPRALDALGAAQRAQGKLVESRGSFKRAQDADWRSPRKVSDYATALLEDGNAGEALNGFDRALQANADHLRSMIGKARAFAALARDQKNSDLKAALSLCDGILARKADEIPPLMRAQALAARAEVKLASGDAAGAAKDAADAKVQAPDAVETLRAIAITTKSNAYPLWQAALAKDKYDASLYFDGAQQLAVSGDSASAEKLLAQYAATFATGAKGARYNLIIAKLELDRGDTKDADAALGVAQAAEPANAEIALQQGRSAILRKDNKGAVSAYERAAQLRDELPEPYRQMGKLYFESKQKKEGMSAYADAILRYKAARTPDATMEQVYAELTAGAKKAGVPPKTTAQMIKEARQAK